MNGHPVKIEANGHALTMSVVGNQDLNNNDNIVTNNNNINSNNNHLQHHDQLLQQQTQSQVSQKPPLKPGQKPRGRRKKIRTEPIRPICPQCEKQFSNQSALTKHKLTHSDERKFACQQCSKAFKRHDHLTGHMQTHSNRKPFNCTVQGCDKTYCDARSLRRHKENIHHIVTPRDGNGNNQHNSNISNKSIDNHHIHTTISTSISLSSSLSNSSSLSSNSTSIYQSQQNIFNNNDNNNDMLHMTSQTTDLNNNDLISSSNDDLNSMHSQSLGRSLSACDHHHHHHHHHHQQQQQPQSQSATLVQQQITNEPLHNSTTNINHLNQDHITVTNSLSQTSLHDHHNHHHLSHSSTSLASCISSPTEVNVDHHQQQQCLPPASAPYTTTHFETSDKPASAPYTITHFDTNNNPILDQRWPDPASDQPLYSAHPLLGHHTDPHNHQHHHTHHQAPFSADYASTQHQHFSFDFTSEQQHNHNHNHNHQSHHHHHHQPLYSAQPLPSHHNSHHHHHQHQAPYSADYATAQHQHFSFDFTAEPVHHQQQHPQHRSEQISSTNNNSSSTNSADGSGGFLTPINVHGPLTPPFSGKGFTNEQTAPAVTNHTQITEYNVNNNVDSYQLITQDQFHQPEPPVLASVQEQQPPLYLRRINRLHANNAMYQAQA